jgi:hypothetical protein
MKKENNSSQQETHSVTFEAYGRDAQLAILQMVAVV